MNDKAMGEQVSGYFESFFGLPRGRSVVRSLFTSASGKMRSRPIFSNSFITPCLTIMRMRPALRPSLSASSFVDR